MDQAILEKALVNLPPEIGQKTEWETCVPDNNYRVDARVTINPNKKKAIVLNAEIKKEIRKHHIPICDEPLFFEAIKTVLNKKMPTQINLWMGIGNLTNREY